MLAEKLSHCVSRSLVISNAASSRGLLVSVVVVVVSLDGRRGGALRAVQKSSVAKHENYREILLV